MKTIRDFLRKHALLLLAALVVISVPAGAALGKYAASETVTDKLNLNVSMKTYTIISNVWHTVYQNMGNTLPTGTTPDTIILDYSAPEGAVRIQRSGKDLDLSDKSADPKTGSIYAYYNAGDNAIYIVPETPGRIVSSYNCTQMFSSFIDPTYRNYLKHIVIKNLDTSCATYMGEMFSYNFSLTDIEFSSNFVTTAATDMNKMFYDCKSMTSLDLSFYDTSAVTNMYLMFAGCEKLTSLNIERFNTSNVTNMGGMFGSCSSLTALDLRTFNTSNVNDMSGIFSSMKNLRSLNTSSFDTSKVTRMANMFNGCTSLKSVDVSNFDTSNVTTMDSMFSGCTGITELNLAAFDTANVTNMQHMFAYSRNLQKIYVSDRFVVDRVTSGVGMFTDCSNLLGGNNSKPRWGKYGVEYAHIDGGADNPGYFTAVSGTQSLTNSVNVNVDSAYGFGVDPAA